VTMRWYGLGEPRRESRANSPNHQRLSLFDVVAGPQSSRVSIIPGIDTAAPERTLTTAMLPSPERREVAASSVRIPASTSSQIALIVASGSAR